MNNSINNGPPTFWTWFTKKGKRYLWVTMPGGFVGLMALTNASTTVFETLRKMAERGPEEPAFPAETASGTLASLLSMDNLAWLLPALQALVILALILMSPVPAAREGKGRRSFAAQRQFHQCWMALWTAWLAMYSLFAIRGFRAARGLGDSGWIESVVNPLNNLQSLLLLVCYYILARPTVQQSQSPYLPWSKLMALFIGLTALQLLVEGNEQYEYMPGFLSGIGAGVSLALFIGRLDSKLIDAPVPIVAFSFLYASIQCAFVFFPEHPDVLVFMSALALLLKCILWLFVAWVLESGRLLFYLKEIKKIHDRVDQKWIDFHRDNELRLRS